MDITSGLLSLVGQRLGSVGVALVLVVLAMIAVGAIASVVAAIVFSTAEPIILAPLRW